jgi:hypothetical protein
MAAPKIVIILSPSLNKLISRVVLSQTFFQKNIDQIYRKECQDLGQSQ